MLSKVMIFKIIGFQYVENKLSRFIMSYGVLWDIMSWFQHILVQYQITSNKSRQLQQQTAQQSANEISRFRIRVSFRTAEQIYLCLQKQLRFSYYNKIKQKLALIIQSFNYQNLYLLLNCFQIKVLLIILCGQNGYGKQIISNFIVKNIKQKLITSKTDQDFINQINKIQVVTITFNNTLKSIKQLKKILNQQNKQKDKIKGKTKENKIKYPNTNTNSNPLIVLIIEQVDKLFTDFAYKEHYKNEHEENQNKKQANAKKQLISFIQNLSQNVYMLGISEQSDISMTLKELNLELKLRRGKQKYKHKNHHQTLHFKFYALKKLDEKFWNDSIQHLFKQILPQHTINNNINYHYLQTKVNLFPINAFDSIFQLKFKSGIISFLQQKFVQRELNLYDFERLNNYLKNYINQSKQKITHSQEMNLKQSKACQPLYIQISPSLIINFFQNLSKKSQIELNSLIFGQQIVLISCYLYFSKFNDELQVESNTLFIYFEWICSSLNIQLDAKMFFSYVQNLNSYLILALRSKRILGKAKIGQQNSKIKNKSIQFDKDIRIILKIDKNKIKKQLQESNIFKKFFNE